MALLELPNEITSRILWCFADGTQISVQSLKNVRLCSHRVDALAQPVFYSSFKEISRRSFDKLLTAISRDDRLTKYVETFEAGNLFWWRGRFSRIERLLSDNDEMLLTIMNGPVGEKLKMTYQRAAEYSSRHPADLVSALKEGDRNGLATLSLLALPAIRHIKLSILGLRAEEIRLLDNSPGTQYNPWHYNWLLWLFNRAAALQLERNLSGVGSLARLRSLDIQTIGDNNIALSQILPLVSVKSVQRFSWEPVDIYWDIPTYTRLSNIRHLSLTNVALSDESMGNFMAIFTAIEVLELTTGLFIKMASHTRHLRHCLKSLTLRNTYGPQAYVQKPKQRSSYQGFDKLHTLRVAAPHIDGWVSDLIQNDAAATHELELTPLEVVIPKSVQDLTFSCCGRSFLEKLGALLASDWLEKSKIRRLELNCHWKYKTWIDGVKEEWAARCHAANVGLFLDYRYH